MAITGRFAFVFLKKGYELGEGIYLHIFIVLPIHWLGNARNRTIELLFYVIVSLYQRNFVLTVHTADMTTKTKQNKTKNEKGIAIV